MYYKVTNVFFFKKKIKQNNSLLQLETYPIGYKI